MATGISKVKFHYDGFDALRKDPAVEAELMRRGKAIADAAGGEPDFIVISDPTPSRARVVVVTATAKAMAEEASNRTLTNALSAGRG